MFIIVTFLMNKPSDICSASSFLNQSDFESPTLFIHVFHDMHLQKKTPSQNYHSRTLTRKPKRITTEQLEELRCSLSIEHFKGRIG